MASPLLNQPLKRMATIQDYNLACSELTKILKLEGPVPPWLDPTAEGRSLLFELMVKYDIWPANKIYKDVTHVSVSWGHLSSDVRIVQITEHDSEINAVAYAVILAIITKLENYDD